MSAVIRRVTIGILGLVAVIGVLFGSALQRAHDALIRSQFDIVASLSQMATTASALNAAQQAYVAPGQPDHSWLTRAGELVQQLAQAAAAAGPRLHSTDGARHLQALTASLDKLIVVDGRIRTDLANGQELSAADLIFTEARETVDAMTRAIRAIEASERAATEAALAGLTRAMWMLAGGVGAIWLAGVLVLLRSTASTAAPPVTEAPPGAARPDHDEDLPIRETAPAARAGVQPPIDLAAAAAVCVDLGRVTSVDVLPDLLSRAATVLDASGIVLWMGAGEDLFPVSAHGYPPGVLARLGPIARHAGNATAAAWRTGDLITVPADTRSGGAIVAPMLGIDGCIGVLAAEIRDGRESAPGAAAIATMFAAQLATIVSAWPAPSEAPAASDRRDPPIAASV